MSGEDIIKKALEGFNVEVLYEQNTEYKCNCSRARAERVIASLGANEVEKLMQQDDKIEIECHFCDKRYEFTSDQLKKIIKK